MLVLKNHEFRVTTVLQGGSDVYPHRKDDVCYVYVNGCPARMIHSCTDSRLV